MKKNNITVFMGAAVFKSKDTLNVPDKDGKVTELKAKNTIIATGASAAQLPGVTVDGKKIVTYVEAIMQRYLTRLRCHCGRRRHRYGICNHLEFLWRGCDHHLVNAAHPAA